MRPLVGAARSPITTVSGLRERNPQLFITPELAIASLRELLATPAYWQSECRRYQP